MPPPWAEVLYIEVVSTKLLFSCHPSVPRKNADRMDLGSAIMKHCRLPQVVKGRCADSRSRQHDRLWTFRLIGMNACARGIVKTIVFTILSASFLYMKLKHPFSTLRLSPASSSTNSRLETTQVCSWISWTEKTEVYDRRNNKKYLTAGP